MRIGTIEVKNTGATSPYIGHDERFIPCLYFKASHRQRATLALADYLSRESHDALFKLGSFIQGADFENVMHKIHQAYLKVAIEQINDQDYPIRKYGDYYFTYLPYQKALKYI